ncbi:alpha/beta fold hydrolase [Haloferula sp. BvORR071]|uniref:esterase/lipase family protein n=1 Tax=Haloferula sp. BvORR071 TaxID=1396141 RepID=UPI00069636FB|nr:alpha/beta fold hydrolase [Haloferula sp. BvORR071]
MKLLTRLILPSLVALLAGCANFRHLSSDLKMVQEDYQIRGVIKNADSFKVPVYAAVAEWDQNSDKVFSADRVKLEAGGRFAFLVKSPVNQYVMALADNNGNGRRDDGEPFWVFSAADGKPAPVSLSGSQRIAEVSGNLSTSAKMPPAFRAAVDRAAAGRTADEFISHRGVKIAVGEVANLDDPRFAATRGEDGLWTPATLAIKSGFGIYFLERYDPTRIPVIFIHGAAGSPQDWRHAMEKIDKKRYQAWFYFYPSGARLDNAALALNEGVKQLHDRYHFHRLHVVAHSMGGLVARRFVVENAITEGNNYINTLVTFSTPWNGHEAAAMGVKWAPSVVPSWYDMKQGSDFLTHLYDRKLKGRVNHHLFYSHHAKRSAVMPAENDGTVSVASELRPEAKADAVSVQGYDETHVSILSSSAALKRAKELIDAAAP